MNEQSGQLSGCDKCILSDLLRESIKLSKEMSENKKKSIKKNNEIKEEQIKKSYWDLLKMNPGQLN